MTAGPPECTIAAHAAKSTGPIAQLARGVLDGGMLSRDEAMRLAELAPQNTPELLYWANRIRRARFGAAVRFCSIVPGKLGSCSEDCAWCAQSARHGDAQAAPKRTDQSDILAAAGQARRDRAAALGIVNSGRRPSQADLEVVTAAAERILANQDALGVCASLGELTGEQAAKLVSAGVTHYNHNLETCRRLFGRLVTTHSYEDRLATLAAARQAGLKLCCGGIFGLGETWADRCELALTIRDDVRPAVVPLNFLHPMAGTPLENAQPLVPMEILRIIAVFRLILPNVDLKIAGGREKNLRDLQSWIFYAGATSCLIGNYLTTSGRPAEDDLRMVEDLGLTIVSELPTQTV